MGNLCGHDGHEQKWGEVRIRLICSLELEELELLPMISRNWKKNTRGTTKSSFLIRVLTIKEP